MIGKTVSHYRIVGILGQGGMGTIYRAEDTKLRRPVALKFITPRSGDRHEETERLLREARAASQLDHPNICTIYDIDEIDGTAFLAMALIDGHDLSERLKEGPLSPDEAIDIATQVASGLRCAHERGIVHRDVKPANIMLTPSGQVKITDFGVAGLFDPGAELDRETTSGTVAYMAPERLRGERDDLRSDVWSWGVLLYEMLAGKRPFVGDYEQAVIYGVLNLEPEPLTAVRSDLPESLWSIVRRALRKDPNERYQSMDEALSDLASLSGASSTPGEARRPLAVLPFDNLTGDPAFEYLRRAIPNLLITSLERSESLRVLTCERMRDLARQIGKADDAIIDADLGFQLCGLDGVDTVVVGSITKAGDTFATDAKVLDAKTKRLIASAGSRGEGVDSILRTQVDDLSRLVLQSLSAPDRGSEVFGRPLAEVTTTSLEAYDCFLRGRDSFEKLYSTDARRDFERAVELDPDFAAAHLYLGWTYARLRQVKARDSALASALALAGKATQKERLYIEAAHARTIEKDPDKELRLLKQLVREYPNEKLAHHRLAGYYRSEGRLYQAVEEYNKAIALDPSFGWAINELGYMHADAGDFERAAECFERYATAFPHDANPVDSMGELLFRMGRLDEAIEKYKRALRLKPDFYYAHWEIAYVSALKEDYAEALKWADSFVREAPSFGTRMEGHRWKTLYLYWLGRHEAALNEADRMKGLAAAEGSRLWQAESDGLRAWVHLSRGELDRSRSCLEVWIKAIDESPTEFSPATAGYLPGTLDLVRRLRVTYCFTLGMVAAAAGDSERARADIAEIGGMARRRAAILEAEALLAERQAERAVAVLKTAPPAQVPYMSDTESMMVYNTPPLRDVLARAYAQHGEVYRAIEEYERLLTACPATRDRQLIHPIYHFRLAELYRAKGWLQKASEEYERFLILWQGADPRILEVDEARSRLAEIASRRNQDATGQA